MTRQQFTRIKELSDVRRMPRLGKLRLGIKVRSQRTGKEHPKEVGWFVCPPEVIAVYGPEPKEIDIMFPSEDEHMVFPQALKWYDRSSADPMSSVILRCKGDKETAVRRVSDLAEGSPEPLGDVPKDPHAMVEVKCPCALLEKRDCRQVANLMAVLPNVSVGGVYQIDSGSTNNIIHVNSYFDYLRAVIGRISWVPLKLRRIEEYVVGPDQRKQKHYLLQLDLNANIEEVSMLREKTAMILTQSKRIALPKPVEDGADQAPGAIIIEGEIEEEGADAGQAGSGGAADTAQVEKGKEAQDAPAVPVRPGDGGGAPTGEQAAVPAVLAPDDAAKPPEGAGRVGPSKVSPAEIEQPATEFMMSQCCGLLKKWAIDEAHLPGDLRRGEAMLIINARTKTRILEVLEQIKNLKAQGGLL